MFCSYFSFKGIPYAQPPLGNLRFRAPLPHPGWSGVRNAHQHGHNCPSGSLLGGFSHEEDCLSLNIYTESLTGSLPIMVYFHGGSFNGGSGNDLIWGPDYFVDEGVIMITINYRLGPLGFLSTNDNNAPGNYGLKDAIMALKWIQANIARFGGDPGRVTVFGESAGGAFVHYLILSPMARGLFARAISQSGSALNPWTYENDPQDVAYRFAEKLGITFSNNADLIEKLRLVPHKELIKAVPGTLDYVRMSVKSDHVKATTSNCLAGNSSWSAANSICSVQRSAGRHSVGSVFTEITASTNAVRPIQSRTIHYGIQ